MNDHLGNNRVVANASGTLVQKNHYYPFGSVFASTTGAGKQPYKYNDKELDAMHGVNLYDYSARYMDSQIGRFTSVDPLAEKYYSISPYVYVMNNPLKYIDPTGMYSTAEWMRDNGVSSSDLINVYTAPAEGSNKGIDDIIIKGANNSSLTVKTDAIDKSFNSSVDFGGNHTIDASNVAIGYERYIGAEFTPVIGVKANAAKQNLLFLSGNYAFYWYEYINPEGGISMYTGGAATLNTGGNLFIAICSDPNMYSPSGFVDPYLSIDASVSYRPVLAGVSIGGNLTASLDGAWTIIGLGASGSVGPQFGFFEGGGLGASGTIGYTIPLFKGITKTSERSKLDKFLNWTVKRFF
ncbi:RHS repeat-associated core domain-containing protein [Dysgonomonas sp. 521]|nr:RHS repeat-associated core domain-containing protein [Dysgonomonas sp. 521]